MNKNHSLGQTLPEAQRVFRVRVVKTFLKAGVPLHKLEDYREILEQHAYKLADKRGMNDLIPFVLEDEQSTIKAEISGKRISIIFDGITRQGEALVIIVRYVENWTIQQRLICVNILVPAAEDLKKLKVIPFLTESVLEGLKAEFCTYIAKASGVSVDINILEWWGKHSNELPAWSSVVKKILFNSAIICSSCRKSVFHPKLIVFPSTRS